MLALGTLVALGTSFGAYQLANYAWNQVVDYRSPYAKATLPQTVDPITDATAKAVQPERPAVRVVYVIVDGMREDVSRKMPSLNALRNGGFDAVVRTGQPSLSFPTWTTLVSGAPQRISGVTTNWFEERVPVETLFDVAIRQGKRVAISAPTDFELLFGVKRSPYVFLRDWEEGTYMTAGIVDNAIRLAEESSASLIVVHSPDIDEAGHASGGASKEYLDTAMKVDADLARLVSALQDGRTVFVVAADHGHIDTGGHAGWEDVVTQVPLVLGGAGIKLGTYRGTQDQVAATVASLSELPAPRNATGAPIDVGQLPAVPAGAGNVDRFDVQRTNAFNAYTGVVSGTPGSARTPDAAERAFDDATAARQAAEASGRLPVFLLAVLAAAAVLVAIGLVSWRALVSAGVGAVAYFGVYYGLYLGLHRFGLWSLSSFNSESLLKGFLNARMIEAAVSVLLAAVVAVETYIAMRGTDARRPKGEYLPGWLALGTATVLVVQSVLALQIAWYVWRYGLAVTWVLPDFMWGFKADLDLITYTALALGALLAPLVTWLFGRYHPFRVPAER